jgi:hypothetical protein
MVFALAVVVVRGCGPEPAPSTELRPSVDGIEAPAPPAVVEAVWLHGIEASRALRGVEFVGPRLDACHRLAHAPPGELYARMRFGPIGRVVGEPALTGDEIGSPALSACVTGVLSTVNVGPADDADAIYRIRFLPRR